MYSRAEKASNEQSRSVAENVGRRRQHGGVEFEDNRSPSIRISTGSTARVLQRYEYPNPGASAEEILKSFDYNWFEAKRKLVYEYDEKKVDKEGKPVGLKLMDRLIGYRKLQVDQLLQEVMLDIAKKLGIKKGVFYTTKIGHKYQATSGFKRGSGVIEALAPGSTNPTSDYDITFSIPGVPEAEIDAVSRFNSKFAKQWKRPSAVVFDTNVYTSGFMSGEARESHAGELGELSEPTKGTRDRIQLALSLLPICQFISRRDKSDWELFKNLVSEEVIDYMERDEISEEEVDYVCIELSETFAETDKLFTDTEAGIEQAQKKSKKGKNLTQTDVMIREVNLLNKKYQQQLKEVKSILSQRRKILANRRISKRALAENLISFERAQGKALVYAQEAYYSAGPVIHVVEGMQSGSDVVLAPNHKLQSILMNIGYKLQHYEHIRHDHGENREGQAIIGTSKYGQRIGHEAAWKQEGNELQDVATVQQLLTSENQFVKLKKGELTSPKEKAQLAEQITSPVMPMEKFVSIAIETIVPYLIAQKRHNPDQGD